MKTGKSKKESIEEKEAEFVQDELSNVEEINGNTEMVIDEKNPEKSDVIDDLEFNEFEEKRFGFKKKKTHSQQMKENIKKEQKKEKIENKKNFIKRTLSDLGFYEKIAKFFDFSFNAGILIAIIISIYYSLYFLITQNPIMALVGCVVVWLLSKLNEKIE